MRTIGGLGLFALVTVMGCAAGHSPSDAGRSDAGPALDGGGGDAGGSDTGASDTGPRDAAMDSSVGDAGVHDASTPDMGTHDAGPSDGGTRDAGPSDAGPTDGGAPDAMGCPAGQTYCAGACVDTLSSTTHCGSCGHACATGEVCSSGTCAPPTTTWTTNMLGHTCTARDVYRYHCPAGGSAGSLWGTGEYTHDSSICTGRITLAAGGDITVEMRPGRSSYLASTRNGITSSSYASWSCSFAITGPACGGALTDCSDVCADTRTDAFACGASCMQCATGTSCSAGTCACPGAQMLCAGTCVDTTTSTLHCGACGAPCPATQVCTASMCGCPAGQSACSGTTCTNTTSDPANCGSCGHACATGETCGGGVCGGTVATWTTTATAHNCTTELGMRFTYVCPAGGAAGAIWGTDVYTHDSSVCTAAVHTGRITLASGGPVTIEMAPGQATYAASTRNGVSSFAYGAWSCSYQFYP